MNQILIIKILAAALLCVLLAAAVFAALHYHKAAQKARADLAGVQAALVAAEKTVEGYHLRVTALRRQIDTLEQQERATAAEMGAGLEKNQDWANAPLPSEIAVIANKK